MADKVGLKENEYTELISGIKKIHEDILQQAEAALAKMESLNQLSGGFYTTDLTPKIEDVVNEFRSVLSAVEDVYNAHEEIIDSFQQSIDHYDTCC